MNEVIYEKIKETLDNRQDSLSEYATHDSEAIRFIDMVEDYRPPFWHI